MKHILRKELLGWNKLLLSKKAYFKLIQVLSLAVLLDIRPSEICELTDKIRVEEFDDYLTQRWYRNHHDAYWYDSHKSKFDIYSGYWSYEAGAISKILKLDDSCLKGVKYYPYDLVHGDD